MSTQEGTPPTTTCVTGPLPPEGAGGPVTHVVLWVGPVWVSTVVPFWVDIHRCRTVQRRAASNGRRLRFCPQSLLEL